jgi:hypothetical protein
VTSSGFNDGNYAVEVPAELRYRLEVPDRGTNWPLLRRSPASASTSSAISQRAVALFPPRLPRTLFFCPLFFFFIMRRF